jgi:hypothetical protein
METVIGAGDVYRACSDVFKTSSGLRHVLLRFSNYERQGLHDGEDWDRHLTKVYSGLFRISRYRRYMVFCLISEEDINLQ